MEKPAVPDYPIHELLARRWSPITFSPKPVPQDVLDRIFEAARWAASSYNEQPWTYILGTQDTKRETFEQLSSALAEANAWAMKAPVLALSVAKTVFSHNNAPNRVAIHDVGAASASLTFQATAEGLFVHQMAGFDTDTAIRVFSLAEHYVPVAMIAIGYPGDPETLDPKAKARELSPRSRKKIQEFVR